MCSGSKREGGSACLAMEGGESRKEDGVFDKVLALLELSAADDLIGFKAAVEENGYGVDEAGLWYGRIIGAKKLGLEERTPLMIASMFGSKQVLSYILELGYVDVNRACGSDGATALHCAVAGGSASLLEVVKLLLDASADINCRDVYGNRPADLIVLVFGSSFSSRRKTLELMLKGCFDTQEALGLGDSTEEQIEQPVTTPLALKDGTEKKEYPVDLSLPDIKNGIYGTDEFRMYTFKIKPCSRAYSHDWTECPFVHPGENARRRDPRKYHYSCVPCPEFRKGSCGQGDACEYAHGIFECWLHPAQYRTRLCKDETGCNRKVCFFAHKPEELRPLYASTGSAMLSPRSSSVSSSLDISSISPFALGSPSVMMPTTPTSPMTPSGASSPRGGSMWQSQPSPALKMLGSRLKTTLSARDLELDADFLGLESYRCRQQQLADEFSGLSSPSSWNNNLAGSAGFTGSSIGAREFSRPTGLNLTNLDDRFASLDPTILSQLHELSLDSGMAQLHQNMNHQLNHSFSSGLPSSPLRMPSSFGVDQAMSGAMPLNSRASAFAKRSQSFIDRGTVNHHSGVSSPVLSSATMMPSNLSDWGSPDGKVDWGVQKEELNKLRKSASFGLRSSCTSFGTPDASASATVHEPSSPWALAKEDPPNPPTGHYTFEEEQHFSPWGEQLYVEQEQLVA